MTENQRQEILNNIVLHMTAQNCTWQQIVSVRKKIRELLEALETDWDEGAAERALEIVTGEET